MHHSTMSLIRISKSIPKNLDYSKFYQTNDTQKSGNSPKGTQKSGSTPKITQNSGTSPYHVIFKLPLPPGGYYLDDHYVFCFKAAEFMNSLRFYGGPNKLSFCSIRITCMVLPEWVTMCCVKAAEFANYLKFYEGSHKPSPSSLRLSP